MTILNLDRVFAPKSIVIVGASDRANSIGCKITDNIANAGFKGKIWLVNPKHSSLRNVPCYPSIDSLPEVPDLALIAIPPKAVPGAIQDLVKKGVRAGIVLTAGIRELGLQQEILDHAKVGNFRIIGPNCLGVMVPGAGLNASFAKSMPSVGNLAFISQSGAIVSAVADWSIGKNIGFSAVVSAGEMADVDIGDLLDYFAQDYGTKAILMYLEQVTDARKFMSAARAAARVKPVVVIKAGRQPGAAKAAASHTGALAGSDAVYDAAFHRAGVLRVNDLGDLFDATEVLGSRHGTTGNRLAIVTNGGGAGILAADALESMGGQLAALSPATITALEGVLPANWSHGNPLDIVGDAGSDRYSAALDAVFADPGVDAVLVMNCPTALAEEEACAAATLAAFNKSGGEKTLLTCWLGDGAAAASRGLFRASGICTFDTPGDAIAGFSYLQARGDAAHQLMKATAAPRRISESDRANARAIVAGAVAAGRKHLSETEAKTIFSSYGIPTVPTFMARTPEEVGHVAHMCLVGEVKEVVVKINSPDITHKSDAGGVALGLPTSFAAEQSARAMLERISKAYPNARLEGFTVQPMLRIAHARELIVGAAVDPTFGPVILFGTGGTAVEVIADRAVALPPLDRPLAYDLMAKTRAYRLLKAYRDVPAANLDAIADTLVNLSELLSDIPEISELDINPLLAGPSGVVALDARIVVSAAPVRMPHGGRFAIRPYPQEWQREVTLKDGTIVRLRPIRPEDAALYDPFIAHTTPEDMRHRFFASLRALSPDHIALLTQIDYSRSMAFVAIEVRTGELLGVSRLVSDSHFTSAEYALLVRSDRQRQGLGTALLGILVDYAKTERIRQIWGEMLYDNLPMAKMCAAFGFASHACADDITHIRTTLDIRAAHKQAPAA